MLARIIIVPILTRNAATDELFTAKQSGKLILNRSLRTRPALSDAKPSGSTLRQICTGRVATTLIACQINLGKKNESNCLHVI